MTTATVRISFNSAAGEDREITYETEDTISALDLIDSACKFVPRGALIDEIVLRWDRDDE